MKKLECLAAQLKLAASLVTQEILDAKIGANCDTIKLDDTTIHYSVTFVEKHDAFGLSPTLYGRRVLRLITETKLHRVCVPCFDKGVIVASKKGLTKRQLRAVLNNLEDSDG